MKMEVRDLTFYYNKKLVFQNISFSVETGDVLFLLGPNGTGKTTLFKVLLGILRPRSGKILFDNEDMVNWPQRKLARYVGYVPQNIVSAFPFSVIDVVLMGRTPYIGSFSVPSKKDKDIALKTLEELDIIHLKDEPYTKISGGERQLVLIARALTQQPKFLIMDEPTSSLDFGNQVKVMNCISKLKSKFGVIISTHMPDYVLRYATKAAMMKGGRFISYGMPDLIVNKENLKELYNVETKMVSVPIGCMQTVKVCIPY
ncbi:MAG: ABC transporter ATP-binding protein [Clostridiaceae bacterium]|nr:ABC transporter ATP-binding protein [Clostridiaceae bacterium]